MPRGYHQRLLSELPWIVVAALLSAASSGCSADALRPRATPEAAAAAHQRYRWVTSPFAAWPQLAPGAETRAVTSFDRSGGNADGFEGTHATLYRRNSGEHVILDTLGPGVLRTLWFTGPEEGGEGLDLRRLRFYIDGASQPALDLGQSQLFCGTGGFPAPLVSHNHQSSGAFVSWIPIPFARRLVVTTAGPPNFVAAHFERLPVDAPLPASPPSARWRRNVERLAARLRDKRLAPKGCKAPTWKVIPMRHRHRGAGTLWGIRFTPERRPSAQELRQARIRIRWDGQTRWSVDTPLGLFFGSGLGEGRIDALAFAMAPGGPYENRLPMPFWRGFTLEVTGLPGKLELNQGPAVFSSRNAGYLHARFFAEPQPRAGEDILMLETSGVGKLVGTVLAVTPAPHTKRWWEGDLRSYVDGRRTPGIHGTGVEDDHLAGWSNTLFGNPFTLPLHGAPISELVEEQGLQHNARISLYRLWPGIFFGQSLRHGFEHGSENTVSVDYHGVAFFYRRQGGPTLKEVDVLRLADERSRRSHQLQIDGSVDVTRLTSAFEGEGYREPLEAKTLAHRGAARFVLHLPPRNQGCWLRRLYDQQRGQQRASLSVDGENLREWYTVGGNESRSWAERGVFLPASVTAGKRTLSVELTPLRGAPPWNAAEYRLLCLTAED